jgi:hypothetical protein
MGKRVDDWRICEFVDCDELSGVSLACKFIGFSDEVWF